MKNIYSYLSNLQNNNNREWFHDNKEPYNLAKEQFNELVLNLNARIAQFDNNISVHDPKKLTFKIVRDTRYSKDKSPYNPAFRAHIAPNGKDVIPVGYYIQIKPSNQSFVGGGLFANMFREATTMIREYIVAHPDELRNILEDSDFKGNFLVQGDVLKNVPSGYDKDMWYSQLLKHKSYYLEYLIQDSDIVNTEALMDMAIEKYQIIKPFNDYINTSLAHFELPMRK